MKFGFYIIALALISGCAQTARKPATIGDKPPRLEYLAVPPLDTTDYISSPHSENILPFYANHIHETQGLIGFSFYNCGENKIVTKKCGIGEGPYRKFSFDFPGRARRDLTLHISDWADTDRLSELMESYLMFFPRKVLFAIEPSDDESYLLVTLPTEEQVKFDSQSKVMIDGVLSENSPVDLSADRFKRKFADISYNGTGVMIRVNRRGNHPVIGTMATVTKEKKKCTIPSKELWVQEDGTGNPFRFATDEELDAFLKKKCKFGIYSN